MQKAGESERENLRGNQTLCVSSGKIATTNRFAKGIKPSCLGNQLQSIRGERQGDMLNISYSEYKITNPDWETL